MVLKDRVKHSLESSKKSLLDEEEITEENKQAVLDFIEECWAEGLSAARIKKYIFTFKAILKYFVPEPFELKEATKKELKTVLANIVRSDYAPRTKKDFKIALKKYYKVENDGEQPDKTKFFSATLKNKEKRKLPEDLISREEVQSLVNVCQNNRDKAFISILYESGTRIGEMLSIKRKNIKFDENGVIIQVFGKTGSRRIRLIESERFLRNWLQDHPSEEEKAPLWVKLEQYEDEYEKLRYDAARRMLKKKARKAGVDTDKIFPHNFRHSRATELANDLTEAQMCEYFGWVQGSDQPATYVHLSGRDIDKEILKIHGIETEDKDKDKPKRCHVCGEINPSSEDFCKNCMRPLSREAAEKADKAKEGMNSLQDWMIQNNVSKEELKEELLKVFQD